MDHPDADLRLHQPGVPNLYAAEADDDRLGQQPVLALHGDHVLRGLYQRKHAPRHRPRQLLYQQLILLLGETSSVRKTNGFYFFLHPGLPLADHPRLVQSRHNQ